MKVKNFGDVEEIRRCDNEKREKEVQRWREHETHVSKTIIVCPKQKDCSFKGVENL